MKIYKKIFQINKKLRQTNKYKMNQNQKYKNNKNRMIKKMYK